MRLKIQVKPFFLFNVSEEQSVVLNYREKYNQIDLLLQTNPGILDTFHADLKDYGSEDGRDSHYSSEQILRMFIVSVIDKVYNWNNLSMASRKVVDNKGCAGVDGMGTKRWQKKEELHLRELRQRLMNDTYRSKPVMRKYIPKPGSKKQRPLGIPAVSDRVCQQAVCNPLSPVFEEYFHEDSYGFRPGRSTHKAAKRVEALRKQGFGHVVDLDIRDFFGQVDREILMELVGQVVKDRRVLGLIRGWLTAGVMEEGNIR